MRIRPQTMRTGVTAIAVGIAISGYWFLGHFPMALLDGPSAAPSLVHWVQRVVLELIPVMLVGGAIPAGYLGGPLGGPFNRWDWALVVLCVVSTVAGAGIAIVGPATDGTLGATGVGVFGITVIGVARWHRALPAIR